MPESKTCTKCGESKPLTDYAKSSRALDGKQCKCKTCDKAYRKANKAKITAYQKTSEYKASRTKYRKSGKGRRMWTSANQRRRALRAGAKHIPYDAEALLNSTYGFCCYCVEQKPLTLDHVIPLSKGGADAEHNIVPCCQSCNSSKNNTELVEWLITRNS